MRVTADWQRVIDTEPRGALVRFRREFAERVWSDPEDLRFATEVGVCHSNGLFRPYTSLIDHDPETPRGSVTELDEVPEPVDSPHGRLQELGELFSGEVFVSLDDGTIWLSDPDQDAEYELINSDLSSLAYVLYKVMAEAPTRREELPPLGAWVAAQDIVRTRTEGWDSVPFADPEGFWSRYIDEYNLYY